MNNGTVKHSCLFLPYSLVFITKLQNPEINTEFLISSCCFSRMLIVLCSQSLTNIYSVCLCEIRGFNEWKNTLIYWPFGELLTEPGFKTTGIQALSLFPQATAAKPSHLWLISAAWVVKAPLIAPHMSKESSTQNQSTPRQWPPSTLLEKWLLSSLVSRMKLSQRLPEKG